MSDLDELQAIGRDLQRAQNAFHECAARLHASDTHIRVQLETRLEIYRRDIERLRAEYDLCKSRLKP